MVKRPPKQVSTNKAEPPGTLAGAIKSATVTADMTISDRPPRDEGGTALGAKPVWNLASWLQMIFKPGGVWLEAD